MIKEKPLAGVPVESAWTIAQLREMHEQLRQQLLAERVDSLAWVGELSTSALSTATAVVTLFMAADQADEAQQSHDWQLAWSGIRWILAHRNPDGGWGDTVHSFSNISTTMLCRAALHLAQAKGKENPTEADPTLLAAIAQTWPKIDQYLLRVVPDTAPATLAEAIRARYGKDRTFSVPILTCNALVGLVDWREVPALPFELAVAPPEFYRVLRLPVVSYALPALIAIGLVQHRQRPTWEPIRYRLRQWATAPALRRLTQIQPSHGGFLEATPLTSFVCMSLIGAGEINHPVVIKGLQFLRDSIRLDGSWPIDTNLATWVTTLSIQALSVGPTKSNAISDGSANPSVTQPTATSSIPNAGKLRSWLLAQQYRVVHPYTNAAPGGWAWTPLPGGVPDADDTPGALLALHALEQDGSLAGTASEASGEQNWPDSPTGHAVKLAVRWLLDLQNADGGWPTFCRGWGLLPFDRSGADLTAHVLRALHVWQPTLQRYCPALAAACTRAQQRGWQYLQRLQHPSGYWTPLWFGNQHDTDEENPVYGTSRTLLALVALNLQTLPAARRAYQWLLQQANDDGGFGGRAGLPSTLEETGLAVCALAAWLYEPTSDTSPSEWNIFRRAVGWLLQHAPSVWTPVPIGFYFAKLWYFERLYPIIWTTEALGRALQVEQKHS